MDINELIGNSSTFTSLGAYRPVNVDQFPAGQYFLSKFGDYPLFSYRAKPTIYTGSDKFIKDFFSKLGYRSNFIGRHWNVNAVDSRIHSVSTPSGNLIVEFLFTEYGMDTDELYIEDVNSSNNDEPILYISVYTDSLELYNEAISVISASYIKREKSGYINMLVKHGSGYDLKPMKLTKGADVNISSNYNDDFLPIHDVIVKSLNEKDRAGLVLLHGIPGSGKSYYLRHLANSIKKDMIYIPPYLTEFLTTPDMLPFLMEFPDSILLIEDAEKVITDREQTASSGVSNILNITDGILSDLLKMQIVATFNMDKDNIDKALLRKGRLIAEYEFGKLSVEKSNAKLEELGKDVTTDIPLTLTEIYNIEDMDFGRNVKKTKKSIGFS